MPSPHGCPPSSSRPRTALAPDPFAHPRRLYYKENGDGDDGAIKAGNKDEDEDVLRQTEMTGMAAIANVPTGMMALATATATVTDTLSMEAHNAIDGARERREWIKELGGDPGDIFWSCDKFCCRCFKTFDEASEHESTCAPYIVDPQVHIIESIRAKAGMRPSKVREWVLDEYYVLSEHFRAYVIYLAGRKCCYRFDKNRSKRCHCLKPFAGEYCEEGYEILCEIGRNMLDYCGTKKAERRAYVQKVIQNGKMVGQGKKRPRLLYNLTTSPENTRRSSTDARAFVCKDTFMALYNIGKDFFRTCK